MEHLLVLEMLLHLHILLKVDHILLLLEVLLTLKSLGGHLAVLWELTLSHIRHELRIHIVVEIVLWNILAMS